MRVLSMSTLVHISLILCLYISVTHKFCEGVQITQKRNTNPRNSFATILAEIDEQVERSLSKDSEQLKVGGTTELTASSSSEDKNEKAKENVGLKNMLDLKTATLDLEPGVPKKQPRHVIVAFLQIAWEAVQRGKFASAQLKQMLESGQQRSKLNKKNLKLWISNHFTFAQARIKKEQNRAGRISDEISHLQHVYQDAVSKEKSYKDQMSNLISEHQLQSTPPLIPAVSAAALPEGKYNSVISRLEQFRQAALTIMKETNVAISSRQKVVNQVTDWIRRSNKILSKWKKNQEKLLKDKSKKEKVQLARIKTRLNNVEIITRDANNYFNDYLNALHRFDIKNRIKILKKEKENYSNVTLVNPYDKVKMQSFMETIKLEVEALEKQLKKMTGSSKVTAPPAAWGVLAGFHPPAIHQNVYPAPSYQVNRPDGSSTNYIYSPAGGVYYNNPTSSATIARGPSTAEPFTDPNIGNSISAPITVPGSILSPLPSLDEKGAAQFAQNGAQTPVMEQVQAQQAAQQPAVSPLAGMPQFREQPSPPPMPELPPPPQN